MCEEFEISRSAYYRNLKSTSADDNDVKLIYEVFNESMKTYGHRRIKQALLEKYGLVMNLKKIARLMKKYNIIPEYAKKRKQYKQKQLIIDNIRPNLLNRNFNVEKPDTVWVTDITYLRKKGTTYYLSTIIDLFDRSIVSYKISDINDNKLVIDTLKTARLNRYNAKNTIIHSDQGFQYLSNEYHILCRKFGFQISMSRKGTPLDNAVIESYHSRLKNETMYNREIKDVEELKLIVFDWLWFYNHGRIKGKQKTIGHINYKEKYKKK